MTIWRSITFSRATASAICKSSSLLALTAMRSLLLGIGLALEPGMDRAARRGGITLRPRMTPRRSRACRRGRFASGLGARRRAAAQSLADELVGQHQAGLADLVERQAKEPLLALLDIGKLDHGAVAVDAAQAPTEALAAVQRHVHLDLRLVTGPALEIAAAGERPVDAGRGDFETVGLRHRILEIEHRRDRTAHRLAIRDRHGAVRPLGHDLDRTAVLARHLHPHEPEAEILDRGLDHGGDARGEAGLGDQAVFVLDSHSVFPALRLRGGPVNKKSR